MRGKVCERSEHTRQQAWKLGRDFRRVSEHRRHGASEEQHDRQTTRCASTRTARGRNRSGARDFAPGLVRVEAPELAGGVWDETSESSMVCEYRTKSGRAAQPTAKWAAVLRPLMCQALKIREIRAIATIYGHRDVCQECVRNGPTSVSACDLRRNRGTSVAAEPEQEDEKEDRPGGNPDGR